MWQAEADTELTLSASPTTGVGQKALFNRMLLNIHLKRVFAMISLICFECFELPHGNNTVIILDCDCISSRGSSEANNKREERR